MKAFLKAILKAMGYSKVVRPYPGDYSVLNSKEYVLETRIEKHKVLNLIKKLRPLDVGIDLIRLGSVRDGGYLVPDDLNNIKACFSPGVSSISDFEKDCSRYNMELFLADKSVDKPHLEGVRYDFTKKFIGCVSNDDFITMDDWVNLKDREKKNDLLLQMDIEGAEYISFVNMSDTLLKRFRIIVVEFHDLQKLWMDHFYSLADVVFSKILQNHTCVHVHPNNYCGMDSQDGIEIPRVAEFTFLRNDRFEKSKPRTTFPHPLDSDNYELYPHVSLPKSWYNVEN